MKTIGTLLLAALCISMPCRVSLAAAPDSPGPKRADNTAHRNLNTDEIRSVLKSYGLSLEAALPVGCAILDPDANPVTEVPSSTFGQQAYWLKYAAHGVRASQITFIVLPLFTGSPLAAQSQAFHLPQPDDTDISTPFGIPLWAFDLTTGPWLLIVENDLGNKAGCRFTVVK